MNNEARVNALKNARKALDECALCDFNWQLIADERALVDAKLRSAEKLAESI